MPCILVGMNIQNQIKRTLSQPTIIEYIYGLLENNEILHRSHLAALVCEQFGFHDARGQKQHSGCLKALRELEAAGHFTLPAARTHSGHGSPRRLAEPVPVSVAVPDS